MTNFEKIMQMSVEGIAELLVAYNTCDHCAYKSKFCKSDCGLIKYLKYWLESEVEK